MARTPKTTKKSGSAAKKEKAAGPGRKLYLLLAGAAALAGALLFGFVFYYGLMPNVLAPAEGKVVLVPSGSSYEALVAILKHENVLQREETFEAVAGWMGLKHRVRPGRYRFKPGQGNYRLVQILRSGLQEPVKVNFNPEHLYTTDDILRKLGDRLELNYEDFDEVLNNQAFMDSLGGFDAATLPCMFIPDMYEFYWTISPKSLLLKMKANYQKFWTEERIKKAAGIPLKQLDVCILASLVQGETQNVTEKDTIASLYTNRLFTGMMLQCDATAKFATGNFALKRVLLNHLKTASPYNTYENYGLPPGPINAPGRESIDAVLNHPKTNYLYMCAKPIFKGPGAGSHDFTHDYNQHLRYARAYRKALTVFLERKAAQEREAARAVQAPARK